MSDTPAVTKTEVGGYHDRFWVPRIWDGMTMSAWQSARRSGKSPIAVSKWPMAGIVSALSVFNSGLALFDSLLHRRAIQTAELVGPPIFIIGHWRSGTTLLHEYFVQDPQFTFPSTYACYAPTHFIHSTYTVAPFVRFLMPKTRPMDNMAMGLHRPQEDEFALLSLGLPSPYRNILYPENGPETSDWIDFDYLTLRRLDAASRTKWKNGLDFFLRSLTVQSRKQIVLKSPPHTARIRTILEQYPDAKFVHIHRNPYKLFPSTYNLWLRLGQDEGLQPSRGKNLEEYVFRCFEEMYESYDSDVSLLSKNQHVDVSYKELTTQPVATMQRIYDTLAIAGVETAKPLWTCFAESQREFKKNKFAIAPDIAAAITRRWHRYIVKYGYEQP